MVTVACAAVVGLLCATSPHGELSKTLPSFFEVTTYATDDYTIQYDRSDLISHYDLKDFSLACPQKGCLWIKASAERCAVGIEFEDGAEPLGRNNLYYAVLSKTHEGLKRGLAETYARRRAGDDASFTTLASLVHLDIDTIVCP
jgi:hypothetical protein